MCILLEKKLQGIYVSLAFWVDVYRAANEPSSSELDFARAQSIKLIMSESIQVGKVWVSWKLTHNALS